MDFSSKPKKKIVEAAQEALASVDQAETIVNDFTGMGYSEIVGPFKKKIEIARSVLTDLNTCIASLESVGYTDIWMDTVNVEGNFMDFIGITPADLIGSSAHKKDVCMQGLGDTLLDWGKKIWAFIIAALERVMEVLAFIRKVWNGEREKSKIPLLDIFNTASEWYGKPNAAPPKNKFMMNVPQLHDLDARATFISEFVTVIAQNAPKLLMGHTSIVMMTSSFIGSKYSNVNHGCHVSDQGAQSVYFDPLQPVEMDFVEIFAGPNGKNNMRAATALCGSATLTEKSIEPMLQLCKEEIKDAKSKAATAQRAQNIAEMETHNAAALRAQQLFNLTSVLTEQIRVVRDYVNIIRRVGNDAINYAQAHPTT